MVKSARAQRSANRPSLAEMGLFMPRTRTWMLWIPLALLLIAHFSPAQTAPRRKSHKAQQAPIVLPPLPKGPLAQLPMDQMPATPPKVSYQGGLLTIVAQNSTLGDILRDVHKLTGASIEVPPNATERVVTRLGPGAPRDVLASLLNGSAFNYVMLGSNSDPAAVSSVVLTMKPSGATAQTAASVQPNLQPNQGFIPQMPPPQPFVGQQPVVQQQAAVEGDDSANADDQDTSDDNADQDQAAQGQPGQPDANGVPPTEPQQQPNAGPKTPEQILEMLRRPQPGLPGQPGLPPQQQPPPEN